MRSLSPQSVSLNMGRAVKVDAVSKSYGDVVAVDKVSIDVAAGEFISLLGPSGSGKTTLLMMLAGFELPSAGKLYIGDKNVTHVPPNKRDIGMVFQRYALFPHRTVAQNLAFPLRMRKLAKSEVDRRVQAALEMVRLEKMADRLPAQLSGGQQQRVALARAVIYDAPVILMDEPLGALDKNLRQEMQLEIKQLQQRLGATVIYVTHDQEEALTMSDRVAVLNRGVIEQIGSPVELYDRPVNRFVAGFLGEMNFLSARVTRTDGRIATLEVDGRQILHEVDAPAGSRLTLAIRPERISVRDTEGDASMLAGKVTRSIFNGAKVTLLATLENGETINVALPASTPGSAFVEGASIRIGWSAGDASIFLESR
jgi:mannopine transport system ATP-binding protein